MFPYKPEVFHKFHVLLNQLVGIHDCWNTINYKDMFSPKKGAVSVSKIIYSPVFESDLAPLNQGQYSPITYCWFGPKS